MRYLSFLLTLLIIFAPLNANAQEDQPEAPYLYYYSDDLNAFVIERADGTDTHILGDGLMQLAEEYDMYIDGPGWSPSGEWFAWTAAQTRQGDWSGYKPYAVSADGSWRLRTLDRFEHARMAWAPDRDLLIVGGQYVEMLAEPGPDEDFAESYLRTMIALVDPETDTIIASVERSRFSTDLPSIDAFSGPTVAWIRDGEHAVGAIYNGEETIFVVFDKNGEVIEKPIGYDIVPVRDDRQGVSSPVSPAGIVAYMTDGALVMANLITDEQHHFDVSFEYLPSIIWNPVGRYAFLEGAHLWLLDLEDIEMTLLLESYEHTYSDMRVPVWSPDGRHALIVAGWQLHHLEVETATFSQPHGRPVDRFYIPQISWYWTADGIAVVSGKYDTETSMHNYYINDFDEYITGFIDFECEVNYSFEGRYQLSPDNCYVAFVCDGATIYEIQDETCVRVRPDPAGYISSPNGEVDWHEDSEWLIVHENAQLHLSRKRFLSVVRADGTMRRDLNHSPMPTVAAIGWLPSQIDPNNLSDSVTITEDTFPQPERVLHGSGWSGYLSWSPDSKWLFGSNGGSPTVWDVITGEPVMILDDFDWEQEVAWVLGGEDYEPQVVPRETMPSSENNYLLMAPPDGNYIVTTRGVFDAETEEMLLEWIYPPIGVTPGINPNRRLLALPRAWSDTHIYDTQTWEVVASINTESVATVFSPDGTRLAVSSSWDIQIWDVAELLAASSE